MSGEYTTDLLIDSLDCLADLAADDDLTVKGENWQADNNARARHAAVAVTAYAEAFDRGEPLETVIADMLGDLMHLCDAVVDEEYAEGERVNFDFVLGRARRDYEAEIAGVI